MNRRTLLVGVAGLSLSACLNDNGTKLTQETDVAQALPLNQTFTAARAKAEMHSDLNVFISLNQNTPAAREGRLKNYTMAIKDNVHVKGLPNTAGTPALSDFIPIADAPLISRLRDEGAMILGKANMHELAFGITSNNSVFGPVKNPYDTSKFAGGSSGGSAAAVAARLVNAAIATDTGGSIRIPAALCGVIGFRPSLGRYPGKDITPISITRDVPGPIALKMSDITLLDSVMSQRPVVTTPAKLNTIRLGVVKSTFYQNLHPETARLMAEALETLKNSGVEIVEFEMPDISDLMEKTSDPIALYEGVEGLVAYLNKYDTGINFSELAKATRSPNVQGLFKELAKDANGDGNPDGIIPKDVYDMAINVHRKALQTAYQGYFAAHNIDALVFPTTILPAGPIEGSFETVELNGSRVPTFPTYIANTDLGSVVGAPGITLPIGLTNQGLPVGLELDVEQGQDEKLLSLALAIDPLFAKPPSPNLN